MKSTHVLFAIVAVRLSEFVYMEDPVTMVVWLWTLWLLADVIATAWEARSLRGGGK